MEKFPAFVYYPLQWTWGIIQNIVGLVIYLVQSGRPRFRFGRSFGTFWKRKDSMSMGMFIFLASNLIPEDLEKEESITSQVAVHEYGHTFQSMILGPWYLPVISMISGIWCMIPFFTKFREKRGMSYYVLYTERWANHLGLKVTKRMPHGYRETHPGVEVPKRRKVSEDDMEKNPELNERLHIRTGD